MAGMFFGTVERMEWVASPEIDADTSPVGFSDDMVLEGGGAAAVNSATRHKTYRFTWTPQSPANIERVEAYINGTHGSGLLYPLDPAAAVSNVLPQYWAAPRLGAIDGPNLAGVGADRPTLTTTTSNTQAYPGQSAVYALAGTETPATLLIPVPAGYTFHMGHHGSAGGTTAVTVTPDGDSPDSLTPLGANTTTRTNYTYDASTDTFVTVSITGTGSLVIAGLIAQVLPTGESVEAGGFISGEGHSGCRLVGDPRKTVHRAANSLRLQSLSFQLVEVGAWLL